MATAVTVLAAPASLSRTPVESCGSPQPRTILLTLPSFPVRRLYRFLFLLGYLLKISKELPGPSETHRTSVAVDEAEVYDVYLLFVWQFSKVLI